MFRRYLTILIILFQIIPVFGQKTVSRINYEQAIDKLNCAIAKFYIEDNQGVYELKAYNNSIAEFGCSFEHLMVFIKERQPQMENNGYLAAYIDGLKGEYDLQITNSGLYNKTIELFGEELLIQYDSEENYQELKINLLNNLKRELKVEEIANNEGILIETDNWTILQSITPLKIILILFGVVLLLLLVGLARWVLKYVETGKEDKSAYLPIKNPIQNIPSNTDTTVVNTTMNANTNIDTASVETDESSIPQPRKVIEQTIDVPTEVPIPPKTGIYEEPETQENEPEVFYMPYPKVDGSFYESARHEHFEYGKSTFRFEIKVVEYNLATFDIISNEDVITDIFVNPEIINPVCEIQGKNKNIQSTLKSGVSKIITVIPGTVQLRNSHWRLKQKAVIRFEYEKE